MAGNRVIAKEVPLSARRFIINDAELMGYVGAESTPTLHKKFLDRGLYPDSVMGKTKYYDKEEVDKFILKNNEQKRFFDRLRAKMEAKWQYLLTMDDIALEQLVDEIVRKRPAKMQHL